MYNILLDDLHSRQHLLLGYLALSSLTPVVLDFSLSLRGTSSLEPCRPLRRAGRVEHTYMFCALGSRPPPSCFAVRLVDGCGWVGHRSLLVHAIFFADLMFAARLSPNNKSEGKIFSTNPLMFLLRRETMQFPLEIVTLWKRLVSIFPASERYRYWFSLTTREIFSKSVRVLLIPWHRSQIPLLNLFWTSFGELGSKHVVFS